jgi:hypothetical protein
MQSYYYYYLIGDGRYYRTSYAISGKKALYRFIREEHGIDRVRGIVKVIHRTTKKDAPIEIGKPILVKARVF